MSPPSCLNGTLFVLRENTGFSRGGDDGGNPFLQKIRSRTKPPQLIKKCQEPPPYHVVFLQVSRPLYCAPKCPLILNCLPRIFKILKIRPSVIKPKRTLQRPGIIFDTFIFFYVLKYENHFDSQSSKGYSREHVFQRF